MPLNDIPSGVNTLQGKGVAAATAILWLALGVGCVSLPQPAGPTTVAGILPPPTLGGTASAERAPGAIDGPLRIHEPRFIWRHVSPTAAAFAWQCVVENPSQSTFEVTVVMQLLDIDGRPLASSNQAFRLQGGKSVPVEGEEILEGEVVAEASSWRLEYWVKVPPRPPRDPDPESRCP